MSTPVKMGIVVTQATEFVDRNPDSIRHIRRNMERDIIESGRFPDQASWKREELPREMYDMVQMTRFSLDAVSEAHVIVKVHHEGRATYTDVVEVQIGTEEAAEQRADALNAEHGYETIIVRRADGECSSNYYDVETVPLGYPEPDIKVTQDPRTPNLRDSLRAIHRDTVMRG